MRDVDTHEPAEQVVPAPQIFPHVPQLLLLVSKLTSHPSTKAPLQSAKFALQLATPQVEDRQ